MFIKSENSHYYRVHSLTKLPGFSCLPVAPPTIFLVLIRVCWNGPEVVAAARRRPAAEISSPFDSQVSLVGGQLEFFVCLLPFKSYWTLLNWLEIWHSGSKTRNFSGFNYVM
jgi:hypothetical protein